MELWTILLALCAALASAQNPPLPVPPPESSAPQGYTIAGTVVNAVTVAPLLRAKVSVADTRARMQKIEALTDEAGRFSFRGLPAAKYAMQGSKAGYLPSGYDQHEQFSTAIVTGPGFDTEKLVLRLNPMAMIAGHVLDESGEPVRAAEVRLFVDDHSAGMTRVVNAGYASTDDRGYFDIGALRPGSYFACADAKPWYAVYPQDESSEQHVSQALNVAYPTTFYGGATESDAASPIDLKPGERQEIDIRLSPVPALRLTFQVPAEGVFQLPFFQKRVFDSVQPFPVNQMRAASPGVFEIVGVPAGRYDVRMTNPEPGGSQLVTEMNLSRDGQDLSSIKGEALGSVKLTLKTPPDDQLPDQYAVALRDSRQNIASIRPGQPSADLTFDALPAGKYGIVFFSQGKRYAVKRLMTPSGEPLPSRELNVSAGATVEATAELVAGEARIEGIAVKNGKPLAGVMVALVPSIPESNVDLFRRDQSDFDGTFTLPGVIPGTYTIVAVEDAWGFAWLKAGVLARYVQRGQPVTVEENKRGRILLPDAVEVQPR